MIHLVEDKVLETKRNRLVCPVGTPRNTALMWSKLEITKIRFTSLSLWTMAFKISNVFFLFLLMQELPLAWSLVILLQHGPWKGLDGVFFLEMKWEGVICPVSAQSFSFLIPSYLFLNWRIIALKTFVVFCQTSTWISHRYTYVPSLNEVDEPRAYYTEWSKSKEKDKHHILTHISGI